MNKFNLNSLNYSIPATTVHASFIALFRDAICGLRPSFFKLPRRRISK